jgi:hypothetical protein
MRTNFLDDRVLIDNLVIGNKESFQDRRVGRERQFQEPAELPDALVITGILDFVLIIKTKIKKSAIRHDVDTTPILIGCGHIGTIEVGSADVLIQDFTPVLSFLVINLMVLDGDIF